MASLFLTFVFRVNYLELKHFLNHTSLNSKDTTMRRFGVEGRKKTSPWVLFADRLADKAITLGGALVIATVMGMTIYLVYEVLPLFGGGKVLSTHEYKAPLKSEDVVDLTIDEHDTLAVAVSKSGEVYVWHTKSGVPLESLSFDFSGKELTAIGKTIDNDHLAFGFSDGTVRLGSIDFKNEILTPEQAPKDLKELDARDSSGPGTIFSKIPGKRLRKVYVEIKLAPEIKVSEADSPIVALDYRLVDFGDRPKSYLATSPTRRGSLIFLPQRRKPICSPGAALPKSTRSLCPFQKKRSILDSPLLMTPVTISFLLIVLGVYSDMTSTTRTASTGRNPQDNPIRA